MKHVVWEEHSSLCDKIIYRNGYAFGCELKPNHFIFYANNDFVMLTYFMCMEHGDAPDFKMRIINSCIGSAKKHDLFSVERGRYGSSISRNLKTNNILKKHHTQINHIYADACGREYAITTTHPYIDDLCNQENLTNNYSKAKDYLINGNYDEYLIEELDNLYVLNKMYDNSAIEHIKTIDQLIKLINQQTK